MSPYRIQVAVNEPQQMTRRNKTNMEKYSNGEENYIMQILKIHAFN
jgi:hypothetical protein